MPRRSAEAPELFSDGELAEKPDKIAQAAFDAWNEAAELHGWPKGLFLTAGRPAKIKRAVKDVGGIHAWRALLAECGKSDFLCGRTQSKDRRPFLLKLDWLVAPANLLKVMERNYFEKPASVPMSISKQSDPTDQWGVWLRTYRPKGFWPSHLGPRPEEPGCRAPVPMVEAWRTRTGTVIAPKVVETREQRLASSIVSYRKVGNYERANILEEELAALEKRPPVMVPSPEVARFGMPDGPKEIPPPAVSPKTAPNYARNYSSGPQVTDVVDEYDSIPEGDAYGVAEG